MKRVLAVLSAVAMVAISATSANAQTVIAAEDFDGGALNLISGFTVMDNLDGGPGDWYGIGAPAAWPQVDAMGDPDPPFGLMDVSATSFPGDNEGILSDVESDLNNTLFVISDTRKWGDEMMPVVNSWTFDISSATGPLSLCINMGQQSHGGSFGGFNAGSVLFEYSIDGGPFMTAFDCASLDVTGGTFVYRNMDDGTDPDENFVCSVSGDGTVTKISAETGLPAADTICDKCPPTGSANAGTLDKFVTDIVGNGSTLELRMSVAVNFEVFAFDNIEIIETVAGGPVTPDTATVSRGTYTAGTAADLATSDNSDFSGVRSSTDLQAIVQVDVKGTTNVATPASFDFVVEGSVFSRGAVTQQVFLYDYVNDGFELVDTRPAPRNFDATATIVPTGDLSRFVQPGTGCVEARIRYQAAVQRAQYGANIDMTIWNIN
ncbi:MAG: hypothetical protein AAF456_11425 [Planctomycetota bacterium]